MLMFAKYMTVFIRVKIFHPMLQSVQRRLTFSHCPQVPPAHLVIRGHKDCRGSLAHLVTMVQLVSVVEQDKQAPLGNLDDKEQG